MIEPVWKKRFDSLNSRITILRDTIAEATDFYRKETLQELANCLQAFANRQFTYFYDGFNEGDLQSSPDFPPEHVMIVTLQQISYDLEAIQWAVEQRRHGGEAMNRALQAGDKLTREAVSPALATFNLNNVTVLVYFQKFAEIRMIPYAPVALIGLPLTCVPVNDQTVTRDYLAIPHEVGHYVYWHGSVRQNSHQQPLSEYLATQFSGKLPWGSEWLEELFADVYGGFIAGPVIAQSFQDLQMRESQRKFFTDDGEHPTPFIRPDIYTKVVKKRFDKSWAIFLNERWQERRNRRIQNGSEQGNGRYSILYRGSNEWKHPSDMISLIDSHDNPLINADMDKPLDIMVNGILELLQPLNELTANTWWRRYLKLMTEENKEPYHLFESHFLAGLEGLDAANNQLESNVLDDLYEKWEYIGRKRLRHEVYTQALRNNHLPEKAEQMAAAAVDKKPTSPTAWLPVFQAGGWATKGPQGNPVGG